MRNKINMIALPLVALGLAACAQAPAPTGPQPPVQSAVPQQSLPSRIISPYRTPDTTTSSAPVTSAVPDRSGPSGPLDARTGLHQSALVSVSGSADSQFIVLFRPGQTASSNVDAAPAKLCGSAGVASSRTNSPGSGSAMPGVQTMIVKCGATA